MDEVFSTDIGVSDDPHAREKLIAEWLRENGYAFNGIERLGAIAHARIEDLLRRQLERMEYIIELLKRQ